MQSSLVISNCKRPVARRARGLHDSKLTPSTLIQEPHFRKLTADATTDGSEPDISARSSHRKRTSAAIYATESGHSDPHYQRRLWTIHARYSPRPATCHSPQPPPPPPPRHTSSPPPLPPPPRPPRPPRWPCLDIVCRQNSTRPASAAPLTHRSANWRSFSGRLTRKCFMACDNTRAVLPKENGRS